MKDKIDIYIELFKEIEKKYEVEMLKYKDIFLWPLLRINYFYTIFKERKKETSKGNIRFHLNYILDFIFSIINLFRRAEIIVFSDYLEKRILGKQLIDKIFNGLPNKNVIFFELPPRIDYKIYKNFNFPHVSTLPIHLVAKLLSQIIKSFIKTDEINNNIILKEIESKLSIKLDIKSLLTKYIIYKKIYIVIFKIKKPSIVFINCSYCLSNMAAIDAANTLGIKTIEFQHGLINKNHLAYLYFKKTRYNNLPMFFFSFGDYFTKIIKENYPIDPEHVFTVGSYLIDFMKNYTNENLKEKLNQYRLTYKKIIIITSQFTVENELISFLEKTCNLMKDILFIFIPREKDRNYDFKSKNLILIDRLGDDIDFYQIVKYVDFHSTVYSTCALEAPIFGIPNILININNLAVYHFNFLCELKSTKIANTPEEYKKIVEEWIPPEKDELSLSHNIFFADNYYKNLYEALEKIKYM